MQSWPICVNKPIPIIQIQSVPFGITNWLIINGNDINDTDAEAIATMTNLQILDIGDPNDLSFDAAITISEMPNLKRYRVFKYWVEWVIIYSHILHLFDY